MGDIKKGDIVTGQHDLCWIKDVGLVMEDPILPGKPGPHSDRDYRPRVLVFWPCGEIKEHLASNVKVVNDER